MSYASQALLSSDGHFRSRIASCVAVEDPTSDLHPTAWADQNQWQIAAAPGFAEAYQYALDTGVPDPGNDPAVITDGQILAAVQLRLGPMPIGERDDPAARRHRRRRRRQLDHRSGPGQRAGVPADRSRRRREPRPEPLAAADRRPRRARRTACWTCDDPSDPADARAFVLAVGALILGAGLVLVVLDRPDPHTPTDEATEDE